MPDKRLPDRCLQALETLESAVEQVNGCAVLPGLPWGILERRLSALTRRVSGMRRGACATGENADSGTHPCQRLIGRSNAMAAVRGLIRTIAPRASHVLILGASGTGKELAAQALHQSGPRRSGRFVAVDCGALNDTLLESELFGHSRGAFTGAGNERIGLVEAADQGTLFLDELANASPAFQTRLLRVIQEGELRRVGENQTRRVSLRIIAATSGDLPRMVQRGQFRGDLYYRINVLTLQLPALADRAEDIEQLAGHFLEEAINTHGLQPMHFSPAALEVLMRYPWPGNIRELRNIVERCALLSPGSAIRPEGMPSEMLDALLLPKRTASQRTGKTGEQLMIEKALLEANGTRTAAARAIGWPRSKLYRRLQFYRIPAGFGRS